MTRQSVSISIRAALLHSNGWVCVLQGGQSNSLHLARALPYLIGLAVSRKQPTKSCHCLSCIHTWGHVTLPLMAHLFPWQPLQRYSKKRTRIPREEKSRGREDLKGGNDNGKSPWIIIALINMSFSKGLPWVYKTDPQISFDSVHSTMQGYTLGTVTATGLATFPSFQQFIVGSLVSISGPGIPPTMTPHRAELPPE